MFNVCLSTYQNVDVENMLSQLLLMSVSDANDVTDMDKAREFGMFWMRLPCQGLMVLQLFEQMEVSDIFPVLLCRDITKEHIIEIMNA